MKAKAAPVVKGKATKTMKTKAAPVLNTVSYSAAISACRRAAMTGALQLLREMPVKAIVLAAAAAAAAAAITEDGIGT